MCVIYILYILLVYYIYIYYRYILYILRKPADRLDWSCRWANEVSIGGVVCIWSLSYPLCLKARLCASLPCISPCLTAVEVRCRLHPITTLMTSYGGWLSSPPFSGIYT